MDTSEITSTLQWHFAVRKAREAMVGEQSFRDLIRLAQRLIDEETAELMADLDTIATYTYSTDVPMDWLARAAKEAADVLFVVMQAMATLNIPFSAVYQEVLASNWSKLEGTPSFDAHGKLLKGAQYRPADVMAVLEQHLEAEKE